MQENIYNSYTFQTKMQWPAIFILIFFLRQNRAQSDEDIQNSLGKSHFSPLTTIDEIYAGKSSISLKIIGLEEILKVKTPTKSFFTSLLPSSSTPKAYEIWNEITSEANKLRQTYGSFYDPTLTTCYIINLQTALQFIIKEISDGRVKRASDDSTTTTTTTPSPSEETTPSTATVNREVNVVLDHVKKLKANYGKSGTTAMQIRASTFHSIRIILQCWVNSKHRIFLTRAYEEIMKIGSLVYVDSLKQQHAYISLNDLRKDTLDLIKIMVSGRIKWNIADQEINESAACDYDLENLTYATLQNEQDEDDKAELESFCTSTPQVCVEKVPKLILKKRIIEFGVGENDATNLVEKETDVATIYRKALEIQSTSKTKYTLTNTVNYGELINIDTTKLTKAFKEGYNSDDSMFNTLTPLLNELKFLNIVYATELKNKDKPLSQKIFQCNSLQDKPYFSRNGNKLFTYNKKYENKNVNYPLPFCGETCKILISDPYVELENNTVGIISSTMGSNYGFISKINNNKPLCSTQKRPSDICVFKDIPYAKQMSVLNLFVYHCTKSEGCNFFNEGKVVAKGFVSIAEFNSNFIDSENDQDSTIFDLEDLDKNELVIKGLIYSAISGAVLLIFAALKKLLKISTDNARYLVTCSCCKQKANTRRTTRYVPANTQDTSFITPQVDPNQE